MTPTQNPNFNNYKSDDRKIKFGEVLAINGPIIKLLETLQVKYSEEGQGENYDFKMIYCWNLALDELKRRAILIREP